MPVSFSPDDASQGFGVNPGLYRVVSADVAVHQFPQGKEGKQSEPFVCIELGYLPIDESGKAVGEVIMDHSLRIGPKFGERLETCKFAPAVGPNQPLPLVVGSKGRYLEAVGDTGQLHVKSKPMLYFEELRKCGFDNSLLKNGDISHLIGIEGMTYELVSKNEGTDNEGKALKDTKIPAFRSIRNLVNGRVSHSAAAAATASAAGSTAAAPHVNGSAAAGAVAGTAATAGDAESVAVAILHGWRAQFAGKESVPLADANKKILLLTTQKWDAKFGAKPDKATREAAAALLANEDFYASNETAQGIAILSGDTINFTS